MKNKILQFLMEQEGFVSGQEMCDALGVSRTAVWKNIKILKEEGYAIESVTKKGYRLLNSPDVITQFSIEHAMKEECIKGKIVVYDEIDSTNEAAKRDAAAGAADESLYVSDYQVQGKGRRGRQWLSPKGQDIFYSILLRPDILPAEASMLTLIAALSGVAAANKYTGKSFLIKWPNDIVCDGKKVCGILTEMSLEMETAEISYVVIGIGWNLNREQFDESISENAGSILTQTGKRVDRAKFLSLFMEEFMHRYHEFLKYRDLSFCMDEYNQCLVNVGKEVKIVRKEETLIRYSKGINEKGELLVIDEDGREEPILSGEVSVRGLYGYI